MKRVIGILLALTAFAGTIAVGWYVHDQTKSWLWSVIMAVAVLACVAVISYLLEKPQKQIDPNEDDEL